MTTTPKPDETDMVSVQFKAPKELIDRLDAECDRVMVGRQIVLRRGAELMADHLASVRDPLANLTISTAPTDVPELPNATRPLRDNPQA